MRRTTTLSVISLLLTTSIAIGLVPTAAAMTTHVVCPTGCTYATIGSAIAAASTGDTIVVQPGTYVGSVTINVPHLTLCSTTTGGTSCANNADNVILEGNSIYPVFITADDVTVRGLTIRNPTFTLDGLVDPSLIVVFGVDRVSILNNVLEEPAGPLLPGQSRWYTIAVNVATGSDDLLVRGNTMRSFPSGVSGGGCANAPCAVIGVWNWGGGSGMTVQNNDIRILGTGASPASAIQFTSNAGVVIRNNFLRLPGSAPGSAPDVVGIKATGSVNGALIEGNNVAPGLVETWYGLYGVFGVFQNSVFRDNEFRLSQHGMMLRTSLTGGNIVEDNLFFDNHQGLLNYAKGTLVQGNDFQLGNIGVRLDQVTGTPPGSSANVVLRENVFRDQNTNLQIAAGLAGIHVDARENDWGAYDRDLIDLRVDDQNGGNTVDVSCFIDADGVTRVCPVAGFTIGVTGASWPRTVTLTDTTVSPRSYSRAWTLPGGATSDADPVVLSLGPGSYSFTLDVEDSEGFTDSVTQALALANNAPTLSLPPMAANEGALFSQTTPGGDVDGDTLSYALVSGPAGLTVDAATGEVRWTPGYADAGAHSLTVSVSDGDQSATSTTTITVANTPVGPVFAPVASRTVAEAHLLTGTVSASAPSGVTPVFTLGAAPAGFGLVDNADGTATYSWTPPSGALGTYAVPITATTEGIGASATLTVNVVRTADVRLDRIGDASVAASPGESLTLRARVTNLGSAADTFTFSVSASKPWVTTAVAPVTLGPAGTQDVAFDVTLPANADVAFVTLRACSTTAPTKCSQVLWRIDAPLRVTLDLAPYHSVTGAVRGKVVATYLDGSAVAGASVIITETHDLRLGSSHYEGTTDGDGEHEFELTDVRTRLPGRHVLYATVRLGDSLTLVSASYGVGP